MAKIHPFRAFHYNTKKFSDLTDVIIPPYDTISDSDAAKYRSRSPYNFAHILLPQIEKDDYVRSAGVLKKWKDLEILAEDREPSYYCYRQEFTTAGISHVRRTLMCTVTLHDFSDKVIRPHENTFGKYKADRLQILRSTQCNLDHIFGMVKDPEGFLASVFEQSEFQSPLLQGRSDEGVTHAIWKIPSKLSKDLETFFDSRSLYIVDGHHRYESSLNYAREKGALGQKDAPASQVLFAISNSLDPALVVWPTHRVVKTLGGTSFSPGQIESRFSLVPWTEAELIPFVKKPRPQPEFVLWHDGKFFLVTPKDWQKATPPPLTELSVYWSDHKLLKEYCGVTDENRTQRVGYEKDVQETLALRDKASAIIFHAPTAVSQVTDIADAGQYMPQKSTYFYPKLAAGLIMRDLRVPLS